MPWEMPVNQRNGIHLDAPQLVSTVSFENVKDYITRLRLLVKPSGSVGIAEWYGMVCVPRKGKHDNKSFAGRDSPARVEPGKRNRRPHALGGSPTGIQGRGRFKAAVDTDPKLRAHSPEECLICIAGTEDQMYAKFPQLFGRLPKSKLHVKPVHDEVLSGGALSMDLNVSMNG